ncbi:MFS transporter [Solicola gregarius]|uniref:MFS transporter n=1 Tax=Solicola gregarius TaxID=2908642 RepID=A0AA46TKR6_9ACTN|nr:MFS transporter [Solicola gregarius]UYM06707.1 MFS transporter [Solicola gregarius]
MEPPNQPPPPGDPGPQHDGPESRRAAKAAQSTGRAAQAVGRSGRFAVRKARQLTHAQGAGESGLARLLELHAFNTGGDAAVAVALAGTLFFAGATSEARSDVAWFLLLTMVPFAIVAPLIGPFLDRFRRGRRWAIGATMAIRAFCCWILAGAVADESTATLYPAALGVLVASKAYGVTRASAVPRLLPPQITLVKANSRISLTGTAGAMLSGPIAAATALIGAEWTCRYAFVLFTIATILAILLPERVDSSEGEEQVGMASMGGARTRGGPAIAPSVVRALRGNAGMRFLIGFLLMYMAFVMRNPTFDGWDSTTETTILLGLVLGSLGAGQTAGTLIASFVRSRAPEAVILVVMVLEAIVLVACTLLFSIPAAIILALTAGVCGSLGKLSLDALIQRDISEDVRTSVFARSETLMQLSWVVGGFVGILAPLDPPRIGLTIASICVVVWTGFVLYARVSSRRAAHPSAQQAPDDPNPTRREARPADATRAYPEPRHTHPDDRTIPHEPIPPDDPTLRNRPGRHDPPPPPPTEPPYNA